MIGLLTVSASNAGAEAVQQVFAPGTGGVANNSVGYTTSTTGFSTFRTFSIKVVMSGSNTVDVPKVRDLRAIAFPAG